MCKKKLSSTFLTVPHCLMPKDVSLFHSMSSSSVYFCNFAPRYLVLGCLFFFIAIGLNPFYHRHHMCYLKHLQRLWPDIEFQLHTHATMEQWNFKSFKTSLASSKSPSSVLTSRPKRTMLDSSDNQIEIIFHAKSSEFFFLHVSLFPPLCRLLFLYHSISFVFTLVCEPFGKLKQLDLI